MNVEVWSKYMQTKDPVILNAIVRGELRFIRNTAWRLSRARPEDYDDIYQEVSMGLVKAVQRWQPEKGKWETYAFYWMRKEVQRRRKRSALISHEEARLAYDKEDVEEGGSLIDNLSVEATAGWDTGVRELAEAIDVLPAKEREVMLGVYQLGDTFRSIGERMGYSRQRAEQLHAQALQRVRKRLSGKKSSLVREVAA